MKQRGNIPSRSARHFDKKVHSKTSRIHALTFFRQLVRTRVLGKAEKLLSRLEKFLHNEVPRTFRRRHALLARCTNKQCEECQGITMKYCKMIPGLDSHLTSFLTGEPAGGAGAAGQPDRRAALRHGQAILGARAGHGMMKKQRRIGNTTAFR